MKKTLLNSKENFESWPQYLIDELNKENINESLLGQELLFENKSMKIWKIVLAQGERLPFQRINCNLNVVSMTNSMVIVRSGDGRIELCNLEEKDSLFLSLENNETLYDMENIGREPTILHLTEFKPVKSLISKRDLVS